MHVRMREIYKGVLPISRYVSISFLFQRHRTPEFLTNLYRPSLFIPYMTCLESIISELISWLIIAVRLQNGMKEMLILMALRTKIDGDTPPTNAKG